MSRNETLSTFAPSRTSHSATSAVARRVNSAAGGFRRGFSVAARRFAAIQSAFLAANSRLPAAPSAGAER
ncbi:MAG: hypothetical protein LBK41_03515 [Clostridiales bacterium]|nr:hypothetical protein [Clostridiales bacterium]